MEEDTLKRENGPRIFIAGIMQGSMVEKSMHGQNYRDEIAAVMRQVFPNADIYDPRAAHKNSIEYIDEKGIETFLRHNRQCGTAVDLLIAFLPEASMGSAIEMWEAWKNGAAVISVSPMTHNWAVKFLSHKIYPDVDALKQAAASGEIAEIYRENRKEKR